MLETNKSADHQRFETLLPFYVTAQLPPDDQAFMQQFINSNPSAQSAIDFVIELRRIVRTTGIQRDANIVLNSLLVKFEALHKKQGQDLPSKLRALGIKTSLPLIIAIAILGGQLVNYAIDYFKPVDAMSTSAEGTSRVSVTLKHGVDAGALAVIAEKFGGKIIHSAHVEGVTKFFVELVDKTRLQALIDALVDSGLIESAAILF